MGWTSVHPFLLKEGYTLGVAFTARIKRYMESKARRRNESLEELEARAERLARDATSIVVRLKQAPGTTVQLPRELAFSLLRRKLATVVGSLEVIPDVVLTEDDVDDLEADGVNLWNPTETVAA
jgi:hypothetical protein